MFPTASVAEMANVFVPGASVQGMAHDPPAKAEPLSAATPLPASTAVPARVVADVYAIAGKMETDSGETNPSAGAVSPVTDRVGGLRSIWMPLIGPAVAQLPTVSQTC